VSAVRRRVKQALREGQVDEQLFRDESVRPLRDQHDRLQKRIDSVYVEELDGKVRAQFFEQKWAELREEQASLRRSI